MEATQLYKYFSFGSIHFWSDGLKNLKYHSFIVVYT
jgi:hypothetical protein